MKITVASSLKCTAPNTAGVITNSLNKFLNGASGALGSGYDMVAGLDTAVSEISDAMSIMTSSMSTLLEDKLVDFVDTGLQAAKNFIFNRLTNPLAALAQSNAFISAATGPVNGLFNAFGCLGSTVKNALKSTIKNLLLNTIKKGFINPLECAVEDFIGALTGKITNMMDAIVSPLIAPLNSLFGLIGRGFGSVKGLLAGGLNVLSKVQGLLNCKGGGGKCHTVTEYDLKKGSTKPKSDAEKQNSVANIFSKMAKRMDSASVSLDKQTDGIENWGIFGGEAVREDATCNTGNILDCGLPRVEFFGGGGEGAAGDIILGNFIENLDESIEQTEVVVDGVTTTVGGATQGGTLVENVKRTASIIGVDITYPGEGYTSEPFVSFVDDCDQGFGAFGRATIDKDPNSPKFGQVTGVVMITEGLNYPTGEETDVFVDYVEIENGGQGYSLDDDLGDFKICDVDQNGKITKICPNDKAYRTLPLINPISIGVGAILTPVMTKNRRQTGVINVIDCIAPRNNGIVGFVDGKPYRGPFHLHPTRGVKMVGVAHTSSPHAIIYDTPEQSLRSESTPSSNVGSTQVNLRSIQQLVEESESTETTTPQQTETNQNMTTYSDPVDEAQNNTPPPSPPSSPPSSPPPSSPPPSSGGGGYGGY